MQRVTGIVQNAAQPIRAATFFKVLQEACKPSKAEGDQKLGMSNELNGHTAIANLLL